jgi:3-methylfumaryl-CoA hydratase
MNSDAEPGEIDISAWAGREDRMSDVIEIRTVAALAATLDQDLNAVLPAGLLPPLWHWAYFTPSARTSELGVDGHPKRAGLLPPIALPNRMWAGGRLKFLQALRIGERVSRASRIAACNRKSGRSGDLVFVTVEHTIAGETGVAIVEEQDIVYRQQQPKGGPLGGEKVVARAEFQQHVHPDAVLLFRYSALTFNSHRIHYDLAYTTNEEGYPGLVVHGPLVATLLLQVFRAAHPDKQVTGFAFRALGPLVVTQDFEVCGRLSGPDTAELWTDCDGRLTMKADVTFAT